MQYISKYITCYSATDMFEEAYSLVNNFGEKVESRIGATKHLTDMTFELNNPHNNVCLNKTRNLSLKYMLGEISWYMSGSNRVEDIGKYGKMWYNLSDDGETVNSAYGYRIFFKFGFNQLDYCINKLKQNPYDRQCILHIKDASNKPTKDTPCTCLIQFTCEEGKLNAHTYMRSNDIWLGLPYDVAFFTSLLHIVCNETHLPIGKYYHTVGDLHLYEKHWDKHLNVESSYDKDNNWDFSKETTESINAMINGQEPTNKLLNKLWRMNNDK